MTKKNEETTTEAVATEEIVFQDPPATRGGRATSEAHAKIAEILKANVGQWAKVKVNAANDGLASSIRRGTGVAFRDGVYEARSVKNTEKSYDIFARYIEPRPAA